MLKNGCCGAIMSNTVKFATVSRYANESQELF